MTDTYTQRMDEVRGEVTDCRSEDGITVGLIDAVMAICGTLAAKGLADRGTKDVLSDPVAEALYDLQCNEDVKRILSTKPKMFEYIKARERYDGAPTETNRVQLNNTAARLKLQGVG